MAMASKNTGIQSGTIRTFTATRSDGTKARVSTRLPTQEELEAADLNQSSAFNQALMHGLPTRAFLIRKLKKNGVWDSESESELGTLKLQLDKHLDIIRSNKNVFKDEAERAAFNKKYEELATKIGELNGDFESLLVHTADVRAESAYSNYIVACVSEYADSERKGERIYDSVEGFEQDSDTTLGGRMRYEYNCLSRGLPSDLIEKELAAEAAEKAAAEAEAKAKADLESGKLIAVVNADTAEEAVAKSDSGTLEAIDFVAVETPLA
jgi:hypothetical protein